MRPGRALLTMLSVVIGVAGVVAVTTATNATHQAYRDMYAAMTGRAASVRRVRTSHAGRQPLPDTPPRSRPRLPSISKRFALR